MLCRWILLLGVLAVSGVALGQEPVQPDQLKKMYDDAMVQLKAAHDRKNELAGENQKLKERIAELEKQAQERNARIDSLETELAGYAERTFFLRSHYAAWQAFMQRHPQLLARWKAYLERDLLSVPGEPPGFMDPGWPLSARS